MTPLRARRGTLAALAAMAAAPMLPGRLTAARAGAAAPGKDDVCANGTTFERPLALPGGRGYMGYYDVRGPFTLRATGVAGGPMPAGYVVDDRGAQWRNPVLVAPRGTAMRVTLANALDAPTIVHWHGLAIDGVNDGNGDRVAAPGARFDYAFAIANRAGTYWYHPHPHGLTAGQAHRGLFGVLLVDDAEDRALAAALATTRGEHELVLALSDRRSDARDRYAPGADDLVSGYLGDEMLVNGTARPYLDVATRGYRLRIVNAANARTFRLAFRGDDGTLMPFTLLGTDGGLLARPIACTEAFVASAERIDVWVDFARRAIGDSIVMESLAFDPMHGEGHGGHAAHAPPAGASPSPSPSSADAAMTMAHGAHDAPVATPAATAALGDGVRLALLQFRVRARAAASPAPPATLSSLASPPEADGDAVPFRLSFAKGRWRINDRVFDMAGEPLVVPRNTVQTWLLRNYYTSMPHAMHLHGFGFRVIAREQSPDFLATLAVDAKGRLATDLGVKDTVLVWPGESVRVTIDFACAFPGPQDYLLHCHNLEHEDGGMMLRLRVA
jgi:suppressor of ftsI/bilirubin oxidase